MKANNKFGISLISVSIAVVVLLILLSTVSISLTYSITNAKKLTFAKEIYNIQSIVDEYIKREKTLPEADNSVLVNTSGNEQFSSETVIDGKIELKEIDLTQLGIKNTKYGNKEIGNTAEEKAKDVFAVSEQTGKVYYILGFESAGKKYYTLTDDLRKMIEKKQDFNIGEKTITFTPSKIGWSNEGISVNVFVPSEYTNVTISTNNTNIASPTSSLVADGTNYSVNSAKVAEGYTITVDYTKNGTSGSISYEVKLDKDYPAISKDENVQNTESYVKGLKANDSNSGIKYFKYVDEILDNDVSLATYMHEYGKDISNGSIEFMSNVPCTLYAEDKAGNYSIIYIDSDGNLTDEKPSINLIED